MSNSVFPSLPGLDIAVEREVIHPRTVVHRSVSGLEFRTTFGSLPTYRYLLRWNVLRTATQAPAPWAAYTEGEIVLKFLSDHAGALDSFLFTDPKDGVQRRVRFDSDSLTERQIVSGHWELEATLLSVK